MRKLVTVRVRVLMGQNDGPIIPPTWKLLTSHLHEVKEASYLPPIQEGLYLVMCFERELDTLEELREENKSNTVYGMTDAEVISACANVGVDLKCATCASIFYTGVGASCEHTCVGKLCPLGEDVYQGLVNHLINTVSTDDLERLSETMDGDSRNGLLEKLNAHLMKVRPELFGDGKVPVLAAQQELRCNICNNPPRLPMTAQAYQAQSCTWPSSGGLPLSYCRGQLVWKDVVDGEAKK